MHEAAVHGWPLIIGGPHDGSYWNGQIRDTIQINEPTVPVIVSDETVQPDQTFETTQYRLASFSTQEGTMHFYVREGMTDYDAMLELIETYHTTKPWRQQ